MTAFSLTELDLILSLAVGEIAAAEETVPGGQKEGGHSPASDQALVSPSPQSCLRHPGGCSQIPPPQAPEEDSAGDCQSTGTGGGITDVHQTFRALTSKDSSAII